MNTFKKILIAIVLVVFLHTCIKFGLSGREIFPCPIWYGVGNQPSEWVIKKCDINYTYENGLPAIRLTPGGEMTRLGVLYLLPLIVTSIIMYGFSIRKR